MDRMNLLGVDIFALADMTFIDGSLIIGSVMMMLKHERKIRQYEKSLADIDRVKN